MLPYSVPNVVAVNAESTATLNETRPPNRTRLNTSRLTWSVPNKCTSDGGRLLSAITSSGVLGGKGASTGARTTTAMIATTTANPTTALGSRRNRCQIVRHGPAAVQEAPGTGASNPVAGVGRLTRDTALTIRVSEGLLGG